MCYVGSIHKSLSFYVDRLYRPIFRFLCGFIKNHKILRIRTAYNEIT